MDNLVLSVSSQHLNLACLPAFCVPISCHCLYASCVGCLVFCYLCPVIYMLFNLFYFQFTMQSTAISGLLIIKLPHHSILWLSVSLFSSVVFNYTHASLTDLLGWSNLFTVYLFCLCLLSCVCLPDTLFTAYFYYLCDHLVCCVFLSGHAEKAEATCQHWYETERGFSWSYRKVTSPNIWHFSHVSLICLIPQLLLNSGIFSSG